MKQIFNVFAFTFRDAVRKKAFIMSSVIILVIIVALCSVPQLLNAFTGGNPDSITENFYTCYVSDKTGKLAGCEAKLNECKVGNIYFTAIPDGETEESIRTVIADDAKLALVTVALNSESKTEITVVTKDFLHAAYTNASDIAKVLNGFFAAELMTEYGIDGQTVAKWQTEPVIITETEGSMNLSGYAVGILLITLTFFAVYYYGYGVASSVASEKSSRVMETLIVSTSPAKILIGKCLGMGAVGLCQFMGIIGFAALSWTLLIPTDFMFMGQALTLSAFTPRSVLLIIVFFILGYTLYALMNAVCGASVSKIEDLNSAMMPVMIVAMGAFYLSYFTAVMGTAYDYLIKLSMYIPFSAPFIMPYVLLNGEVTTGEILISLGILTATVALAGAVSIRVYKASVMHYGKRLKLTQAYKAKL